MAIRSSWTPRLKSVKFEFDTQHTAPANSGESHPQSVVIENPLPFDIPGVPRRFVFEPPRRNDVCQINSTAEATYATPVATSADPLCSEEQGKDLQRSHSTGAQSLSFPKPTGVHTDLRSQDRLIGGSCDISALAAESRIDLAALVSAAWAIVLSYQTESLDVILGLKISESSSDAYPVRVSVNRQRPVIDVQRDIATYVEQIERPKLRADDIIGLSGYTQGACSFKSIIDFRQTNFASDEPPCQDSPFVLSCLVPKRGKELALSAWFDERVIQRDLVRFLLSDLEHVLWQMLGPRAVGLCVQDIEPVGPASQRAMVRLNRPLYPKLEFLAHHLIAGHVAERPGAPAIEAWDGSLTYAQLNAQSDNLAEHLARLGVGPEVSVPIILEKSKLSIIAILAVVKAGGAIVPMDPSQPLSRLHMMAHDVKAAIAVTSVRNQGKMPPNVEEVVLNDRLLAQLATNRTGRPMVSSTAVKPDNALYVMFTSGSTGKPKGVVVSHTSFCSSFNGFKASIRLMSPDRRVLQYASFGFDASIVETLGALTVGACICIPSDGDRLDNIAKCIVDLKANWTFLTPSVARLLRPEDVPQLECLCLGGEAFPKELADTWADHVAVVNAYGPTECAIMALVSEPICKHPKNVSLGKPRNCAVWIVNEDGNRIQPFNTVGEIVIEGPGIARGYLGDETKTAAVFGEDADFLKAVACDSSRFYRTGDLGRMNVDGTVDYCGRKDNQVKINGQRIEMGEVEHHVKTTLSVLNNDDENSALDVVVELLQPANSDRTVLAAFVAPGKGASPDCPSTQRILLDRQHPMSIRVLEMTTGLQELLSKKLPVYMMPKVVLPCGAIPQTPSGKTDRKRLRQAGNALSMDQLRKMQEPTSEPAYLNAVDGRRQPLGSLDTLLSSQMEDGCDGTATPSTSTEGSTTKIPSETSEESARMTPSSDLTSSEELLRGIWAEILELREESILPGDDFLKLGGDSIGFIRIVAACRRADVHVTVATIANFPVLTDMARACQSLSGGNDGSWGDSRTPFSLLEEESLEALRKEAASQCGVQSDITEDLYPCTHMQEELMVANIMHPGVSMGRFIHRLPEDIDVVKFKGVWEDVWEASPVLRTRFVSTLAGSLQVVIKETVRWSMSDNLEAYIEADDANHMLPGSPLTRVALVVDNDETVYFVWTMHHMLYDGWSVPLLCRRVNALYSGALSEPAADFREFVSYAKNQDQERNAAYWQTKLEGVTPSTFPAPANPEMYSLAQSTIRDHLELPSRKEPCLMSGLTMSTVIQAAWAMMIGQYSKTDDVLFGATISGRNAPVDCIESIEGPTLATVPVRLHLSPDARAVDFLRHVQDHFTGMMPYEQTGLKSVRAINEDTKRGCDFQNLLLIQAEPTWEDGDGPLGQPLHRGEDATVPVLCQVWLQPSGIDFDIVFDENRTSRKVVEEAVNMVKVAIKQLLKLSESSSTTLAAIKLEEEVPERMNKDSSKSPRPLEAVQATIHGLISDVPRHRWREEAVCSSEDSLSYRDLERLSSNLGLRLLTLGIGRGNIIPLCFEKSVWTVVAMLAVLKTGAAFVLLDPSQPSQRLRELMVQMEAQFMLLSPAHTETMDFGMPVRRVVVDAVFLKGLPTAIAGQLPCVSPDDLAYMIFTSGSTGRPKGVKITHSAFASSSAAYVEALQLGPKRRVLQFSSYSFDASLNEILVVLIRGATVCVPSEKERIEDLAGFMRRAEVDWAILTPSVARLLSPSDVPLLETLDLGGEAPDGVLLSKWHQSGVGVFNVYGPAEGSGTVLCQRYNEGIDPRTIGFPMGCEVWIVDANDHDRLLAHGETGEMLLEGPVLASGYFKDEQKTALSFISNPKWAALTNASSGVRRMYKTGDLGFRKSNGAVVYVGRKDLQVKINGQRIELGDIEANLATCAGVKRCAVFYPAAGPFKQQLTAVIELGSGVKGNEAIPMSVRTELGTKVPSSMVPTHWVDVVSLASDSKTLRLNSSGKVDRRHITAQLENLPAAEAEQLLGAPDHQASRDAISGAPILESEQPAYALAEQVYSMLPARGRVGLTASDISREGLGFDDLLLQSSGLDSLNMMSLMYFLSREFHVKVSMQLLMDKRTTVRKLARFVSDSQSETLAKSGGPSTTLSSVPASIDVMAEICRQDSRVAALQQRRLSLDKARLIEGNDEIKAKLCMPLTVLLTGGNGFVGTQILRQLLEHHQVGHVIAVVRGETADAARNRTIDAATRARWWTDLHAEKLQVWQGDLSLPQLGLEATRWSSLEDGKVDVIIHNGAAVHWAKSFAALEAANVSSTVELLSLAVNVPHMRFAYVSGGRKWTCQDEREEDVAKELSSPDAVGYSQTKFVAEAVVKRAALRCASVSGQSRFAIVNPGLVIGTPTEGVANMDDYIWRLTAACIRVGAYSSNQTDAWVDLSDVAALATTIIDAAFERGHPGTAKGVVTYVTDGMTWGQFWAILAGMGYRLEARGAAEWLAAVRDDIEFCKESHPLWPLAHMLESQALEEEGQQETGQSDETPLKLKVAVRKSAEFLGQAGYLPMPPDAAREATQVTKGGAFSRSGL